MKGMAIIIFLLICIISIAKLIFDIIGLIFGSTVTSPEQLKEDYKKRVVKKYTKFIDRKIYSAFAKKNLSEVTYVFNIKMKDADLDILKEYYTNKGFSVERTNAGVYGKIKPSLTFKDNKNAKNI